MLCSIFSLLAFTYYAHIGSVQDRFPWLLMILMMTMTLLNYVDAPPVCFHRSYAASVDASAAAAVVADHDHRHHGAAAAASNGVGFCVCVQNPLSPLDVRMKVATVRSSSSRMCSGHAPLMSSIRTFFSIQPDVARIKHTDTIAYYY